MTVAITTNTTEQTLNTIQSFKIARMPLNQAQNEVSDLLEEAIVDIENNPPIPCRCSSSSPRCNATPMDR